MSYIDKYFGGSYSSYKAYFGDKWQTQYRYVLNFIDDAEVLLLKENPVGWNNLRIKFIRNWKYFTVWRNFVLSLKFELSEEGGGLRILYSEEQYGLMTNTQIEIYERDSQTDDFLLVYDGVLNYKPGKYKESRNFIAVGINDGNIEDKIKSREDISYNVFDRIGSDGDLMPNIPNFLKEIIFKTINIYQFSEGNFRQLQDVFFTQSESGSTKEVGLKITDADYVVNEIGRRLTVTLKDITDDSKTELYHNTTGSVVTFSFNWNLNFPYVEDGVLYLDGPLYDSGVVPFFTCKFIIDKILRVIDPDDIVKEEHIISRTVIMSNFGSGPVENMPSFRFSHTDLVIDPDDKLYYIISITASGMPEFDGTNAYEMRYVGDNQYEAESCREISQGAGDSFENVILPDELFSRLAQLITGQQDTDKLFYSEEFGRPDSPFNTYDTIGEFANVGLIKGKILRGYPDEPLQISLETAFQSFNGLGNLCLLYDRINERIQISPKAFAFNKEYLMFDLGEVSELTREPMSRAYFNKIVCGWKSQTYEEINGANEYNAKAEYSEIMTVKTSYNIAIPINGDGTSMELCRRYPYISTASEDTKYDENLYLVDTDGVETIQGGCNIQGYVGVDQNYNQRFTPRQNLVRHGNILLPSLHRNAKPVAFNGRDKNTNVSYEDSYHGRVNENDPITKDELAAKGYGNLFEPFIYKHTKPFTREIINIIRNNGNGYYKFTYEGNKFEAFIDEAEVVDYPKDGNWTSIAKAISEGENKIFEDGRNHITENAENRILE